MLEEAEGDLLSPFPVMPDGKGQAGPRLSALFACVRECERLQSNGAPCKSLCMGCVM